MQRSTKNGRPIINKESKLPLYELPVALRIKNISKKLFGGVKSHQTRWENIQQELASISN